MLNYTRKNQVFPLARLSIFIKGHPVVQGKFYYLNEKPVFLVNIDDNKLWHNYNGYSIANDVLEHFAKAKIRPLILYKHIKNGLIYQTVPSKFYKKAIQVNFGDHRQLVLPVKEWKFFKEDLQEPFNLPLMNISTWLNPPKLYPKIDMNQYIDSKMRLKQIWQTIKK